MSHSPPIRQHLSKVAGGASAAKAGFVRDAGIGPPIDFAAAANVH
jgi:hypothetical protein